MGTEGPKTSASRMPTRRPNDDAAAHARLTAVVDFPTPPLPDATAIMRCTPVFASERGDGTSAGGRRSGAGRSNDRWIGVDGREGTERTLEAVGHGRVLETPGRRRRPRTVHRLRGEPARERRQALQTPHLSWGRGVAMRTSRRL
eukprot:31499-Pelagococcus_subviridis.AAC.14